MPFLDSLPAHAGPPAVFTRYPELYGPWSELSQALMNGPSELSQGERELLLAFAAGVSGCEFVYRAHREVAYAWGVERGLVERLVADPEHTAADERFRPVVDLARKLAAAPASVDRTDVDAVLGAGWSEDTVHDVIAVTARAAFMQRLVQGFGFTPLSPDVAAERARKRVEHGYVDLYPELRRAADS